VANNSKEIQGAIPPMTIIVILNWLVSNCVEIPQQNRIKAKSTVILVKLPEFY